MTVNLSACVVEADRATVFSQSAPQSNAPTATSPEEPALPPELIEATLAGETDQVRSLLKAGTNPNIVFNTNTALIYAARDGFTEIATVLIDYGANVNWIDGEGVTPLILAAFKGHQDIVALLLSHDADVTVADQWGRTALDYALRRGEEDAIAQHLRSASHQ